MTVHVSVTDGPPQPDTPPFEKTTPTLSLSGLRDLLAALELELASLPSPTGLFAMELRECLEEKLEGSE